MKYRFQNSAFKFFITLLLICSSMVAYANQSLAGVWKNAVKPAWLEINFTDGTGVAIVKRHDKSPKTKGLEVLTSIVANESMPDSWNGKIYSASADKFIEARLLLKNEKTLVVLAKDNNSDWVEVLRLNRE